MIIFSQVVYRIANVIVFMINWNKYGQSEYQYLINTVGTGLQAARASANVINLNLALILFPVCRNLLNFTRGVFESKRSLRRLFDKNILFHKCCAYMICLMTFVHIGSHFLTFKTSLIVMGVIQKFLLEW